MKSPLANERGGIIIVTVVIVSLVIVIFSGIMVMKLSAVNRESFRVNEAVRYINIMEEMGSIVARARAKGRASATCQGGTSGTAVAVGADIYCLPAATVQGTCITDNKLRDSTGAFIQYCLSTTGLTRISKNENEVGDDQPTVAFDIVPVPQKSLIERAVASVFQLNSARAACPAYHNWNDPNCIEEATDQESATSNPNLGANSDDPIPDPPAYSVIPGGTASQMSDGSALQSRANMELGAPTSLAWTHTNDIYTPMCTSDTQQWLGCMRCAGNPVNEAVQPWLTIECIDVRMCPPNFTGTGCANPYRQRILVY